MSTAISNIKLPIKTVAITTRMVMELEELHQRCTSMIIRIFTLIWVSLTVKLEDHLLLLLLLLLLPPCLL
jgi:hypothetical protein